MKNHIREPFIELTMLLPEQIQLPATPNTNQMRSATHLQPNIPTVVKNGLKRQDNSLDVIQSMRSLWRVLAHSVQQRLEAKGTQATTPSSIQSTQRSQKRVAGKPAIREAGGEEE